MSVSKYRNEMDGTYALTEAEMLAIARAHWKAQRWDRVKQVAESALTRWPYSANVAALLGWLALVKGEAGAGGAIEAAAANAGGSVFPLLALAAWRLTQGASAEALPILRLALERAPDEMEAALSLASLLLQQNEPAEAELVLRSAWRARPGDSKVACLMAEIRLDQGRRDEGEMWLNQAAKIDGESDVVWQLRARFCAEAGYWEDAADCAERALWLSQTPALAFSFLARIQFAAAQANTGRRRLAALEAAEKAISQSLLHSPTATDLALLQVTVWRAQGRHKEALMSLGSMLRSMPDQVDLYVELAKTQLSAGNAESALMALKSARDLAPEASGVLVAIVQTLLAEGRAAEAYAAQAELDARLGLEGLELPAAGQAWQLYETDLAALVWASRFMARAAGDGHSLRMAVPRQAMRLVAGLPGVFEVLDIEAIDVSVNWAPLHRLPHWLRADDCGAGQPWVKAPEGLASEIRARLAKEGARAPLIGIDIGAEADPELLGALRRVVTNLQGEALLFGEANLAAWGGVPHRTVVLPDLELAAAWLSVVDGIVGFESPLMHLAGGMGLEGCLLVPVRHGPLWGEGRERSPWYPSLRLCHEDRKSGWGEGFRHLADMSWLFSRNTEGLAS